MCNGCRRDSLPVWSQLCSFTLCKRRPGSTFLFPPPPTSGCPGRHRRHFKAALSLITGELLQAALIITSRRGKAAHVGDSEGPSRMTHLSPSQPHDSLFHNTALSTKLLFDEWGSQRAFWGGGDRRLRLGWFGEKTFTEACGYSDISLDW